MAISRKFLGLDRPALAAAAEYLLERFRHDRQADLSRAIVVVPGGRAGRRLLEILVDKCDSDGMVFTPPEIVTVGRLPELLYQAKQPFADDLVQQLAWSDALKNFDRQELQTVIARLPENGDSERWHELGRMLQTLHRELASDGLDFADVIARGKRLERFPEMGRWQVFANIQQAYLKTLDDLQLWDRQTARLYAIEHRECRIERPLILIGAVDLNRSIRQMLDQVADLVTALIYAPDTCQDRFDSHGCLIPEKWESLDLQIPNDSLVSADDPVDQADAVARRIAGFERRFRAEDITVGLPDERIVPQLARQLDECNLPNRFGPGQPLSRSSVIRLLEDLADWLEGKRYEQFAAIARHPDAEAWLLQTGVKPGWIEQLDDYYNDHLPVQIDGKWLGREEKYQLLRDIYTRLDKLTQKLTETSKPLDQWLGAIGKLVLDVYGFRNFDLENSSDRATWKACNAVQDALGELASVPPSLMPKATAGEALRMLLGQLRSLQIAPTASEAAIELVGWLELPLDDAPALIVTSFNEGFVPSSAGADLFLPGGLRSVLGLDDNARRYARDAYAVTMLLAPWRTTTFIVARRNADNDPLAPSRLLFAAPNETVARRALEFFKEEKQSSVKAPLAGGLVAGHSDLVFEPPRPVPLDEPITRMSVTSFSTYLACPYRFYLTRVLRLGGIDDQATELDGAAFGNLAHDVLEDFGKCDERDSSDAGTIQRTLNHLLSQFVARRFGKHPGAAVLIQVEQLKLRLKAFAAWQAKRREEGWKIEHAEVSFSEQPGQLDVDGQPMFLTGRIDRIDVNEKGDRQILDYKTSDAGDKPEKTHRRRNREWVDLQLPLYRHLARTLGIHEKVGLGYVLLPKNSANVGLALAEWSEEDLAAADKIAVNVARNVRQQEFWPPTEPPPPYSEDLAYICMDGVFGRKKSE